MRQLNKKDKRDASHNGGRPTISLARKANNILFEFKARSSLESYWQRRQ